MYNEKEKHTEFESEVEKVSGGVGDINVDTSLGGIEVNKGEANNSKNIDVVGNIGGGLSL